MGGFGYQYDESLISSVLGVAKEFASHDKVASGGGRHEYYSPPKGTERAMIRFLPSQGPMPVRLVYVHWNIPELKTLTCYRTFHLTKSFTDPCPMCNLLQQAATQKIPVEDYISKPKTIAGCLVLSDESKPNLNPVVPMIFSTNSDFDFRWILEKRADPAYGDILHPLTGVPVIYQRKIAGKAFDRSTPPRCGPIAATEDEVMAIMEHAPNVWEDIGAYKIPDEISHQTMMKAANMLKRGFDEKLGKLRSGANTQAQSMAPRNQTYSQPPPAQGYAPQQQQRPPQQYAPPPQQRPAEPPQDISAAFNAPPPPSQSKMGVNRIPPPAPGPVPGDAPMGVPPTQLADTILAPPMAPVAAIVPVANAPAGAPSCFGDPGVWDATRDACMMCAFELACANRLRGG